MITNEAIEKLLADIFGDKERAATRSILEDVADNRSATLDILALRDDEILSMHTGRSGREIVWYYDGQRESARFVDTNQRLTREEIENELC